MTRHIVGSGKYLRLVKCQHWEYVERAHASGVVVILAVTSDHKLILVEQFRYPVNRLVIELPAGLVGDIEGQEDEAMEVAASRELLEETGYAAQKMELITEGPTSPGLCAEQVTFYRARDLKKVQDGGGDETESIRVHEVPLSVAFDWLKKIQKTGVLVDPKVYAGLYFALREKE